ncbi:MAG: acyltransferase [Trichormus sp. ATA11-4-KO1]|jgi:fucose 4-O-acetylase-like acetyltransferase|nr:acyltransferase [Trichormus sp. ATA11-4-KO1]
MHNPVLLVEPQKNVERDIRFDLLKTIGILLIILSHVIPRNILFHVRSFDVQLMVIVSGALFYASSYHNKYSLKNYLQKRIPRLIAPVWLFLSFFFISYYILFLMRQREYPFSRQQIIESFLLLEGIGYVWIIRVFVIIAIISTLVLNLYKKCQSKKYFLLVLLASHVCHEFILKLIDSINIENTLMSGIIQNYFLYIIPYGCLFGLGLTLPRMKRKSILVILGISLTVFLALAVNFYNQQGTILYPQSFKYPPKLYYLSYGIFMSMLAFLLVDRLLVIYNLNDQDKRVTKIIVFISSSTLWIYLWHIFSLHLPKFFLQINLYFFSNDILSFLVITLLSITATYMQKLSINKIINKTKFGQNNSKILATLFLK